MNQSLGNEDLNWKIYFHPDVVDKDIPKIDKSVSLKIQQAIKNKIIVDPLIYGLPLRGTLNKYWKLRVGDWRIIYKIIRKEVYIFAIDHRSKVYKLVNKRV